MADFENGICGCFENFGMCVFTYFLPCYTQGKLAESLEDDCLLCGLALMVPLVNIFARMITRQNVRENKGIEGSGIGDLFAVCCCGFCALVQEAREMQIQTPLGAGESMGRA
ncbi:protein PLANT CADMIUM RESISTANCE 3-like [Anneissia japonica]|uniref:protein PLANT CADMIUM RESISTANCE 3-like n=1 Tax=Anneissia japonica TaxID=1529436 RepID=UPI001425A044|nr:protein PLANT CADMIUM RESISTANCE 3-like [Anneissia japonica]